jgi:archaellum component FlaC
MEVLAAARLQENEELQKQVQKLDKKLEAEHAARTQLEGDLAAGEVALAKQKGVTKTLREQVERYKADMGELRDKCEVLEEEYDAVKKQLQTEIEN